MRKAGLNPQFSGVTARMLAQLTHGAYLGFRFLCCGQIDLRKPKRHIFTAPYL